MNILMTNHRLQQLGGTELFVVEIAAALQQRGHQVCVFSTVLGEPLSTALERLSIPMVTDPKACPFKPDLIHGQHHLETMASLSAWPCCPAIYFVHGATPWEETPPRHPRIGRYLGTSPRFAWSIAQTCHRPAESVIVAPNFFDATRFTRIRPETRPIAKALVFHNTMAPNGPAFKSLQTACEKAGLPLAGLGYAFGNSTATPETHLPEYDLVFAAGRSAIEAMACGCAVIPITATQADAWICPENFEAMRDRNFSAEINAPPLDSEQILLQIRRIRQPDITAVTQRIRQEATLEHTLDVLLHCYSELLENPPTSTPAIETECLADYLLKIASHVKDADDRRHQLADQKDRATARAAKWKARAERLAEQRNQRAAPWWKRLLKPSLPAAAQQER